MNKVLRIIFLDVDGVLNCQDYYTKGRVHEQYPLSEICPDRIKLLNGLCERTGAKVVISSSWRIGRTIEELRNIFNEMGATFEIIDKTPVLDLKFKGAVRGNDINLWIEENTGLIGQTRQEYKQYAIIDDDSDMLYWQKDNFFQADAHKDGLNADIIERIERLWNNDNSWEFVDTSSPIERNEER